MMRFSSRGVSNHVTNKPHSNTHQRLRLRSGHWKLKELVSSSSLVVGGRLPSTYKEPAIAWHVVDSHSLGMVDDTNRHRGFPHASTSFFFSICCSGLRLQLVWGNGPRCNDALHVPKMFMSERICASEPIEDSEGPRLKLIRILQY